MAALIYGVQVIFPDGMYWTRRYTYLSPEPVEEGSLVIVPKHKWWSIGKAVACSPDPVRIPGIRYQYIKAVVTASE